MSTPTSSSSSRKRKADVDDEMVSGRKLKIAKPSPSSSPAAHLPASCLAAILNFMEYGDVRRCLLAGKIMAVDAANHVETLSIMNASELVPSAAGRFVNVTEINILSLVTTTEDGFEDALSVGTATRSAPFLISFSKLKHAFLGGIWRDRDEEEWLKYPYQCSSCLEPEDHLSVFRGLVDHLCGAFQSRSLSPSLRLEGVFGADQLACGKNERESKHCCRRCWTMATSFPPALVMEKVPYLHTSGLCLSYSERIEALATRHDNSFLSQSQAATECFLAMTNSMLTHGTVFPNGDLENSFIERMKSRGGGVDIIGEDGEDSFVTFHFMQIKHMESLKKFAAFIGPSVINSIPKHELFSAVRKLRNAAGNGKKNVLARQTFESFVHLGLDLASEDFVLIDPLEEAGLQKYHRYFHSEEEAS